VRNRFLISIVGLLIALQARSAAVDNIELYSTSSGSGPTIIFVHGWTCDTSSWREQLPAFDDDYRVIALDLPGHGQSGSPPPDAFSMDLFADAIEAVRAEAGADRVVLVGHSMGGPVIRQYALSYPEHVAGLVAVDGPLDVRGFAGGGQRPALTLQAREQMIRGMFVPTTPAELQKHILAMMLGAPEATASGAMAAMFASGSGAGGVIEAPAIGIVAGTAQLPNVGSVREVVPNFEATQVAGTGHFVMMEKPAEFNRLLQDFLDGIDF
jgi:pimeloyl-ACP methyl ester carboxylesterase